jgi:hypothetical protein
MKVKELKKWLEDKNDEDYVCELEEYCHLNELSLEYLTTAKDPSFKLKITTTPIDPIEPKKMDFGAITVCSKCGKGRIPSCGEVQNKTYKACCENEGATLIPLRKYTEEVLGVPFDNNEWGWKTEDICLIKDIDMKKEITLC